MAERIRFYCEDCGLSGKIKPSGLERGRPCPKCGGRLIPADDSDLFVREFWRTYRTPIWAGILVAAPVALYLFFKALFPVPQVEGTTVSRALAAPDMKDAEATKTRKYIEVEISLTHILRNDRVWLKGTTNLPEGTVLMLTVRETKA